MKLIKMQVTGYRSLKERQELFIDDSVTVLVGANDHGKTNVLWALRELNEDWEFEEGDRHWDLEDRYLPRIQWFFELTPDEAVQVIKAEFEPEDEEEDESQSGAQEDVEDGEESNGEAISEFNDAVAQKEIQNRGLIVEYWKSGEGGKHRVEWGKSALTPKHENALLKMRPVVELFATAPTVKDEILATQLTDSKFEFMKGIFMKAGLWEKRDEIFVANPRTSRMLDEASKRLTQTLQSEWEQGKELIWRFKHRGEAIVIEIQDPAISATYVSPSQRSAGFTSFFVLALTIFARTSTNPYRSRIFLFDEPGTYLHPVAQINLQRVFESLSERAQIIYTTHSLFLVNKNCPVRNKVIRKTENGTQIDKRPYHRNWKSVRDSLGIMMSHNFLVSDRTLLVEGPSDEVYLLAVLAHIIKRGIRDIDLNDFSIADAGNQRNQVIMAKMMLEEGRKVVVVVDGDKHGKKVKSELNSIVREHIRNQTLEILMWPEGSSIEDLLPDRRLYADAVRAAARLLVQNKNRKVGKEVDFDAQLADLESTLDTKPADLTLGRHVNDLSAAWFDDPDGISKLLIAERYEAHLKDSSDREIEICEDLMQFVDDLIRTLTLRTRTAEASILASNEW